MLALALGGQVAGQAKTITPEEVGAGILSYLKKVAEEFIGRPVRRAVSPKTRC